MIHASDMKFYLDPVQDITLKTSRIYVTEEAYPRVRGALIDTVVEVKEDTYDTASGKHWWVTTDGQFVRGAPISRNSPNYTQHVGLLADGVFVVGEYYGTTNSGNVGILAGCSRSDGKRRPGSGAQYRVPNWMKAAPWAARLMPAAGDSADTVNAKVALAKELHKRRTAMSVILSEAMERDWNADLEPLRDDHDIPTPVFGAYVSGSAMIPIAGQERVRFEDLSEDQRNTIARLSGESMRGTTQLDQRISVPVKFMASLSYGPNASLMSVSSSTITGAARQRLDHYDLSMGAYTLTPVLRTLAS